MSECHSQAKRIGQPRSARATPPEPSADPVVVGEWTGGSATALRRARREGIYNFAASLKVGASTVDAWDKHPDIVPRMKAQRALDQALEGASREVRKRFVELTRGDPLVGLSDLSALDGIGDDTNRSQALKVILSALGAALAPSEIVERLLGDRAGRVDAGLLDSHERLARSLAAEYLTGDPRAVTPAALAQADDLLGLWQRPAADRPRVEALVVGVNARAGLWAFHNGDLRAAHKHLLTAWGVAAASGDPGLLTQAIGMASVLHSMHSGCCRGDPKRAIALLDQAAALAVHADPHTRLWVATWHADEVVAGGNVHAARASVDAASRARELLGDDPDAGGRIGFLVYGLGQQLESVQANLSGLEGRFADADHRLGTVLRSARTVRHQVLVLAQTGRVRAKAGAPEGACEALVGGLDHAEPAGYAMGVERIRGVRDGLPKRWAALSCVRALDERLG